MRRSRNNVKNDIVIDLTSLLDVIFIVLLVVMVNSKVDDIQNREDYNEKIAALEEEKASAADKEQIAANKEQIYNEMIKNEEGLSKYVLMISVTAPYDEEDPHKRELYLTVEDKPMEEPINVLSDDQSGFDDFKDLLEKEISDFSETHPETVIIISLSDNNERILYRDERKLTEILNEISDEKENVYLKGNLFEDE